ncbi:MAG: hypothetical protein A2033_06745 [Bacteroidetes bacterium GWA2_31_9]|nr:MAG: hypothetical protein A2033_06745 [Bacteroidetes bacterium GWA2_31_9]
MEGYTSKTINSLINVIESSVKDSETKQKAYSELNKAVKYIPDTVFQNSFFLFFFIIIILELILNTIASGFESVHIALIGFYIVNALIISLLFAYLFKVNSKKVLKKRLSLIEFD